jgi:hypothetical protein
MHVGTKLCRHMETRETNEYEYRSPVGSLIYFTHSRPDISFVVGCVSRFTTNPQVSHMDVGRHILKYLKGMYDTNRYGTETMYFFCYIAMEIYVMGYTSIFSLSFCLYIQPNHSPSTHNQHQHICLCVGGEPQHSSTKNYTLSHSKQSKPKAFPKSKTFIPNLVFQTITLYKGRRCP